MAAADGEHVIHFLLSKAKSLLNIMSAGGAGETRRLLAAPMRYLSEGVLSPLSIMSTSVSCPILMLEYLEKSIVFKKHLTVPEVLHTHWG